MRFCGWDFCVDIFTFLMLWETANEKSPHSDGVEAGGMGKY